MMTNLHGRILLSILFLLCFLVQSANVSAFILQKYRVFIFNGLPNNNNPLQIRCQSKDDDLGYHNLLMDQNFNWHFRTNFWGTTKFWCHFWWLNKDQADDVFDSIISLLCYDKTCKWVVKEDGFYLNGIKVYEW